MENIQVLPSEKEMHANYASSTKKNNNKGSKKLTLDDLLLILEGPSYLHP